MAKGKLTTQPDEKGIWRIVWSNVLDKDGKGEIALGPGGKPMDQSADGKTFGYPNPARAKIVCDEHNMKLEKAEQVKNFEASLS